MKFFTSSPPHQFMSAGQFMSRQRPSPSSSNPFHTSEHIFKHKVSLYLVYVDDLVSGTVECIELIVAEHGRGDHFKAERLGNAENGGRRNVVDGPDGSRPVPRSVGSALGDELTGELLAEEALNLPISADALKGLKSRPKVARSSL